MLETLADQHAVGGSNRRLHAVLVPGAQLHGGDAHGFKRVDQSLKRHILKEVVGDAAELKLWRRRPRDLAAARKPATGKRGGTREKRSSIHKFLILLIINPKLIQKSTLVALGLQPLDLLFRDQSDIRARSGR